MIQLSELAASIITDAKAKGADYARETAMQVRKIDEETQLLVSEKMKMLDAQAKKLQEEELQRLQSQEELRVRMEILSCKQQQVEKAFSEAREKLANLKGVNRKKLLEKLWRSANKEFKVAKVICAKRDAAFFKKKVKSMKTNDSLGGFLAKSSDESLQVDFFFETLIAQVREQKSAQIAAVLEAA